MTTTQSRPSRTVPGPRARGLAASPRGAMTTGAAITICVGSFVIGGPLRILAMFGPGLAAAVLIDVPVVCMMLVPAVMQLLGPANWWLPRWIEWAIPHLAIEPKLDHLSAGRDLGPAGGAGKVSGSPKETASA
jgi:uncharacterized membrane protein YdfJ with MMPL/SSD domain